ncbi:MAG: 4-phosphoerythronate dehydrogenase [Gammaproteobacteria bacterium]|nr:4-phosphoerythronate dehydrogenase [Pseudomonadales bacterium]
MKQMRIVADADILSVKESFSEFGELRLVPGREIGNREVRDADVLLIRSITRVDRELLRNSAVKLVGTATSGVDHIDQDYLSQNGIQFRAARGCNANAVVDYCFAALARLGQERQVDYFGLQFAMIGAGHVGGLFAEQLSRLGIRCVIHDPLLDAAARERLRSANVESVSFEQALAADVVSLHVPLNREGKYSTWHLLDDRQLAALKPGSVLLNTARGPVVDNRALYELLRHRDDLHVILDVWEHEPDLDSRLLETVALATPHIAGYSQEAKRNATTWLRREVADYFGIKASDHGDTGVTGEPCSPVVADIEATDHFCAGVLNQVFPIATMCQQLRAEFSSGARQPVQIFDLLRRQLLSRREFSASQVLLRDVTPRQRRFLEVMGFRLIPR